MIIRLLHIIFLSFLLIWLSLFSLNYFYNDSPYLNVRLKPWLDQEYPQVATACQNFQNFLEEKQTESRVGIVSIFILEFLYLTALFFFYRFSNKGSRRKKLFTSSSRFTLYLVLFVFLFSMGILSILYFWPSNEINIADMVKINRGSQEAFLSQTIDIGIIVAVAHLFLFLCLNIVYCLLPNKKKIIKKSSRSS